MEAYLSFKISNWKKTSNSMPIIIVPSESDSKRFALQRKKIKVNWISNLSARL